MRKSPDSATDLPNSDRLASTSQAFAIAPHLVEPKRESQTKGSRLRVNAMRAPDLWRSLELERAPLQHVHQCVNFFKQYVDGVAQQQRVRSINYIGRS